MTRSTAREHSYHGSSDFATNIVDRAKLHFAVNGKPFLEALRDFKIVISFPHIHVVAVRFGESELHLFLVPRVELDVPQQKHSSFGVPNYR